MSYFSSVTDLLRLARLSSKYSTKPGCPCISCCPHLWGATDKINFRAPVWRSSNGCLMMDMMRENGLEWRHWNHRMLFHVAPDPLLSSLSLHEKKRERECKTLPRCSDRPLASITPRLFITSSGNEPHDRKASRPACVEPTTPNVSRATPHCVSSSGERQAERVTCRNSGYFLFTWQISTVAERDR